MMVSAVELMDTFFALKTWADLRNFVRELDESKPFQSALKYYAKTWSAPTSGDDSFEPFAFVSEDLAATYLNQCPVIFEGTNQWAEKCYLDEIAYEEKLSRVHSRCEAFRAMHPNASICLVMVPEKDLLISWVFRRESRFDAMIEAVRQLRKRLEELDIPLVFEQPISALREHMSEDDFRYSDSHLHPRNYIVIFAHALKALGFDWERVAPFVTMEQLQVYHDLSGKFKGGADIATTSYEVSFSGSSVKQVNGSDTFEKPLGQTLQGFDNLSPVFEGDICILGDSHSSIFAQRRLTYLFANTFRHTRFFWNPSAVQPISAPIDCRNILLEISSRFVF